MDEEKIEQDAQAGKWIRKKIGKTPKRSRDQKTRQAQQDASTCTEDGCTDVPEEPFDNRTTVIKYVEEQRRLEASSSSPRQEENMAYPILLSFLRGLTDRQWRDIRKRIRDGTTRARLAHESQMIVKVVAQSVFQILFPAMLVMLQVEDLQKADSSSSPLTVRPPANDPLQKYFDLTEESLAQTIGTVSSPTARSMLGDVVQQLNQGLSVLVSCSPSGESQLTTDPSLSFQQSRKQATEVIAETLQSYSAAESSMLGNVVERKAAAQEATLNPLASEEVMKSIAADSMESGNSGRGRGRGGAGAVKVSRKLSDMFNVFSGSGGDLFPPVAPETKKTPKRDKRSRSSFGTLGCEVPTQKPSVLISPGFYSQALSAVGRVLRTMLFCTCAPSSISSRSPSSISFAPTTILLHPSSSNSSPFHISEGTPAPVPPGVEAAASGLIQDFVKEVQGGARSVQEEEEQRGEPLSEEEVKARVRSDADLVFLTMKEKVTEFFRPRSMTGLPSSPDLTSETDPEDDFASRSPSQDLFPCPSRQSWVSWPDSVSDPDDQDVEQVTGQVLKNIVDSCKAILSRLEGVGEGASGEPPPKLMPYAGQLFSLLSGLTPASAVSLPTPNAPRQEGEPEPDTGGAAELFPSAHSEGAVGLERLSNQGFQAQATARVSRVLLGTAENVTPSRPSLEMEAHLDAEALRLVEEFVAQVVTQAQEITRAMEEEDNAREDQAKTVRPPGGSNTQDNPSSAPQKPSRKDMIRDASLKLRQSMQSRLAVLLSGSSRLHQQGCSEKEEKEEKDQEEWDETMNTRSGVGSGSGSSHGSDGYGGGGCGWSPSCGSTSGRSVSQYSMAHLELGAELVVSQVLRSIKKELGSPSSPAEGAAAVCQGSDRSAEEVGRCVSDIVDHLDDVTASGGLPPAQRNVLTNKESQRMSAPPSPLALSPDLLHSPLTTVTSLEFHTQAIGSVSQALLQSLEEVAQLPVSCSRDGRQSVPPNALRSMDVQREASDVVQSLVSGLESVERSAELSPPERSRSVAQALQLLQVVQNQLKRFYNRVLVPALPGQGTGAPEGQGSPEQSGGETTPIKDRQQGGGRVARHNASSAPLLSGASSADDVTLSQRHSQISGPMVSQNFLERQTNEVVQRILTSHKSVISSGGRSTTERPRPSPSESESVASVLSWMDNFSSRTLPEGAWSPVNAANQDKPGSSAVSPGTYASKPIFSGVDDSDPTLPSGGRASSQTVLRAPHSPQVHTATVDRLRGLLWRCLGGFSFPDPSSVTGGFGVTDSDSSPSSLLDTAASELLDTVVSEVNKMVVSNSGFLEITDSALLECSSSFDSVGSKVGMYSGGPAIYRRLQEKLREVQQSLSQDRTTLPGVREPSTAEPSVVEQIKAPAVGGWLGSSRKPSSASSRMASSTKGKSSSKSHRSRRSFKSFGLPANQLLWEVPVKSPSAGRRPTIGWPWTNRKPQGSTGISTDGIVGQVGSPSVSSPDDDPARAVLGRLEEMVEQGTLRTLITQLLDQLQARLEDGPSAPCVPAPVRRSRSAPVLSVRRLRPEVHSGSLAASELLVSFVEEAIKRLLTPVPLPPSPRGKEEKVPPSLQSSSSSPASGLPSRQGGVARPPSSPGASSAAAVAQSRPCDQAVNLYSQVMVEQVLGSLGRLDDSQMDTADRGRHDAGSRPSQDAGGSATRSSRGSFIPTPEVEEDDQDDGANAEITNGLSSFSDVKESIIDAVQRLRRVWKRRNAVFSAPLLTNQRSLQEGFPSPAAPVSMSTVGLSGSRCCQQEPRTAGHFPIRIFSTRPSSSSDLPSRATTAP